MIEYIKSDLCRYVGYDRISIFSFFRQYISNTGFRFSFWLRLGRSKNPFVSFVAKLQHYRLKKKFFLDIPISTNIGYGLYIGHGQCIVISPSAVIGNNVNLSQFTTIGSNHNTAAIIEDDVYIGPNVCIVENVNIGSNSKIGAGAVVVKDIPKNSTVAGVPAKVINVSLKSNDYINNKWIIN